MKRAAPILILAVSLALGALAPTAALAAGPPKKAAAGDPFVELSPVALPVSVSGRVINYVFVSVKVMLSPSADGPKLRAKEPYFRDALVRAGHRAPFTVADDYNRIDEAKLKAALMREAAVIAGPKAVRSIEVVSQAPQKYRRKPAAAAR